MYPSARLLRRGEVLLREEGPTGRGCTSRLPLLAAGFLGLSQELGLPCLLNSSLGSTARSSSPAGATP